MQVEDRQLSDRERTVLLLAADGLTDKEIARHLALSKRTIATYWERIRLKLGSHSRTQLVASFLREDRDERRGEAGYKRLFSSWEDGVWILRPDGRTLYANHRAGSFFGITPKGLADTSAREVMAAHTCLDLEQMVQEASESPTTTEFALQCEEGALRWLRIRASAVRDENQVCHAFVLLLSDLTVERHVQRTLDACQTALDFVSERSSDLIARFDSQLRCVSLNQAFRTAVDADAGSIIGRRIDEETEMFRPNERWVRHLRAAISDGKARSFVCALGSNERSIAHLLPEPSTSPATRTVLCMCVQAEPKAKGERTG